MAVTSAVAGEGKSTLARAIAIATANDHAADVLLIEADLVTPTLAPEFGVAETPGLSDVLAGSSDLSAAAHVTGLPNLWLLPAGARPDNPSRLLRSSAMVDLLQEVREHFRFVVLDLPAILTSSDAAVLARQSDRAILVIRAGVTDQRAVQGALQLLSGAALQGVVLNRRQTKTPDVVRRIVDV
jgi:capsular exopolysaccharide synthesis family protein